MDEVVLMMTPVFRARLEDVPFEILLIQVRQPVTTYGQTVIGRIRGGTNGLDSQLLLIW